MFPNSQNHGANKISLKSSSPLTFPNFVNTSTWNIVLVLGRSVLQQPFAVCNTKESVAHVFPLLMRSCQPIQCRMSRTYWPFYGSTTFSYQYGSLTRVTFRLWIVVGSWTPFVDEIYSSSTRNSWYHTTTRVCSDIIHVLVCMDGWGLALIGGLVLVCVGCMKLFDCCLQLVWIH